MIADLEAMRCIMRRIQNRMINLNLEPVTDEINEAKSIAWRVEKTAERNIAVISERLNYVRLSELFKFDESIKTLPINKLLFSIRLSGLVNVENQVDIEEFFRLKHWLPEEAVEENFSLYDKDILHVLSVIFTVAYQKSLLFDQVRQTVN